LRIVAIVIYTHTDISLAVNPIMGKESIDLVRAVLVSSGKYMKRFFIAAIIMVFHWNATDLFAQTAQKENATVFKELIHKKFDENSDGTLSDLEKESAIRFLKGVDRNGDNKISATEQSAAIDALRRMPEPKLFPGSGVIPIPGNPTEKKGTVEEVKRKIEEAKRRYEQSKKEGNAKSGSQSLKKFYDGSTIITLEDVHTVVPKGSVLHVPEGLAKMIVKQPKGKMMFWPAFLQKYPKLVTSKEVTWKTAKGEDPIKESEIKACVKGGKIVVAVFKKNPLSVLEPTSGKK